MAKYVFLCVLVPGVAVSGVQSLSACIASETPPSFEEFIKDHERTYTMGSGEYEARKSIFDQRAVQMRSQNCQPSRTWKAEINGFSDRMGEELAQFRGWKSSRQPSQAGGRGQLAAVQMKGSSQDPLPDSVDWMHLHALQHPRDQGQCGSCWAFAAAAVLGAHHEIHRHANRTFSVQELVSCTPNPEYCGGSGGCDGATAELAFEYVLQAGCGTEEELPYRQVDSICPSAMVQVQEASLGGSAFGMVGWTRLAENDQQAVMRALVDKGPLAVAVGVVDEWFAYRSGIMSVCHPNVVVNHAVTLVGYGATNGAKHWTLLNSWGRGFGEGGYLRLARHDSETAHCGWDTAPLDGSECARGAEPPRNQVWVCGMCGILYDASVPEFVAPADSAVSALDDIGLLQVRKHAHAGLGSNGAATGSM